MRSNILALSAVGSVMVGHFLLLLVVSESHTCVRLTPEDYQNVNTLAATCSEGEVRSKAIHAGHVASHVIVIDEALTGVRPIRRF
jgi:hypothetical protein